jgi:hypothetical protein
MRTEVRHPHQHALSTDAEVHRLGSDEHHCSNGGGCPVLLEDKIPRVSIQLWKQP